MQLRNMLNSGNILIVSNSLESDILDECIQIHKKNHKSLFVIEDDNMDQYFENVQPCKTKKYDHIIVNPFKYNQTLDLINTFIFYECGNVGTIQASSISNALDKMLIFATGKCHRRDNSDLLLSLLIRITFRYIIFHDPKKRELYEFNNKEYVCVRSEVK